MSGPLAYTDGACLGNPGPGGWGVRILYPHGEVRELGGAAAATTNNRMELQAAIGALQTLTTSPHITVVTDSRYVIDGVTKWLPNWRRRDWLTINKTPVKNQDLWIQLDALNHSGVIWKHVYGHSGEPYNERVDKIAHTFATGSPTRLFCGPAGIPDDPVATPEASGTLSMTTTNVSNAAPHGQGNHTMLCYVSIVHGVLTLDSDWYNHQKRVKNLPAPAHAQVQTWQELQAFCIRHGVTLPPDANQAQG